MEAFESVDELYCSVLSALLSKGRWVLPRGAKTLEITPFVAVLSNPRRRCVTNSERRWSLPLALGEFCWHASASRELAPLEYYAPRWREFSDDGSSIRGSCYGYRIFDSNEEGLNQWERIKEILRSDMSSRRAVLYFGDSTTLNTQAKDVPCLNTAQFLVRDGRLNAYISMRSNDAVWGLPYDIFLFTMLQELLSGELQIPLGHYCHFATSMHIYETHVDKARKMLRAGFAEGFEMPPMSEPSQLQEFLNSERIVRTGGRVLERQRENLSAYWAELLSVLEWYAWRKQGAGVQQSKPIGMGRYTVLLDRPSLVGKAISA
jgi:thymidylate synthase